MNQNLPLTCLFLASCWGATSEERARAEDIASLEPDLDHGAELYSASCAACHGADGQGGVGPALDEPLDTAELALILMWGPGDMPSFETWPDQDLADVSGHVTVTRSSAGSRRIPR
jgi:mono/diheme cytochrome c family protein